ncbi:hypothetical protein [Desmospora activa]|uniref:hypothetical protein n=1 Tax=Desmospora activa TaxID=500615 RepID=UPI000D3174B2|nr:hypothetical protein [Desmospora activa]
MPLKWYGALIAVFSLLFASGCSTVLIENMGLQQEKESPNDDKKKEKEEKEEEPKEKEEEEDTDAQPPMNDESEETSNSVEAEEVTAGDLTFYADNQNWMEESREEDEEGFEYYYFTPDGENADYARELIEVHTYPGVQDYFTSLVIAEGLQELLQEEYGESFSWQVIDQDRDNILAKISITDDETSQKADGMARVFSNDTGIYAIIYYTMEEWTDEKEEQWTNLLIQAGGSGMTL